MYAPENSLTPVPGATERYSRSILLQDLEEDNKPTLTKLFNETTRDDSDISNNCYSDSESDSTPTAAQRNSFPKEFEGGAIERGEVQVMSVLNTLMTMIYKFIKPLSIWIWIFNHYVTGPMFARNDYETKERV